TLFLAILLCVSLLGTAQSSVPSGTMVSLSLDKDIFAPDTKVGAPAAFSVLQEVIINGKVIIPKSAIVRAAVVEVEKGGPHHPPSKVKVQIYDVKAADGSTVVLDNCYVFTMGDGGHKQRGALLLKGIGKNCLVK
nr:hypothetical protein [Chitinophagales bacterium]